MTAAAGTVGRGWQAVRWYFRALSGESRWDDYVAHCARHGHAPVSRRDFERQRTDTIERVPISRCC